MVNLDQVFDVSLLEQHIENKLVKRQTHPTLPLAILNYSAQCQYQQAWDEVTLRTRGLIYDIETTEVISRPWSKFFNWDDTSQPYPPAGPVLRSPKMDGSLGILYKTGEHSFDWAVATRGSFASDQALWATERLQKMNDTEETWLEGLKPDKSYLVEIIFPANRIVVDYQGAERLVLLDVLDTASGRSVLEEFDRVYWLDKVERVYMPQGFSDAFVHDIPEGEEGFVVYWPDKDYRVKMKAADYLALHRMIFSLSERSVWARMGEGETIEDIATQLPDEFHSWVREVGSRLTLECSKIEDSARREFADICREMNYERDRALFAQLAKTRSSRAYLFMLYDGKDIWDAIWKTLKPEGNKTVTTISEDVA